MKDDPRTDAAAARLGPADAAALLLLTAAWAWRMAAVVRGGLVLSAMDSFCQHIPDMMTAARAVAAGRLPLWNPLLQAGMPLLGYVESAALYPGTWLFAVLSPGAAQNVMIGSHWLALGVGMYAWARALRLSPAASFVSAFVALHTSLTTLHFAYSGFVSFAWMPWLGFFLTRLDETGRARYAALSALAIALPVYGGHVQYWTFWLLACAAYSAFLVTRADARERPRKLRLFAAAWAAGAAFAALQALATLEFLSEGWRSLQSRQAGYFFGASAPDLARFLTALTFDWPDDTNAMGCEMWCYVGLPALLLAAYARKDRTRRPLTVFWAAVALAGAALVLVRYTHVERLLRLLPLLSQFHGPERELPLVVYPLCLLAGVGLDAAVRPGARGGRPWPARLQWIAALALLALCAAAVPGKERVYRALTDVRGGDILAGRPGVLDVSLGLPWRLLPRSPDAAACGALVALVAALALTVWRTALRLGPAAARLLLVGAVVADFGQYALRPLEHLDTAETPYLGVFRGELPPAARIVREKESGRAAARRLVSFGRESVTTAYRRVLDEQEPFEVLAVQQVVPNVSQAAGVAHVGIWHDAFFRREFSDAGLTDKEGLTFDPRLLSARAPLLPLLDARYVTVNSADLAAPDVRAALADRRVYGLLYRDRAVSLWERRDAFPRFRFVDSVRRYEPARSDAVMNALLTGSYEGRPLDLGAEALVEGPAEPDPPAERAGADRVELESWAPESIALKASVARPRAFLVASEAYDPGWRARVDGEEVPVRRADLLLRGVFVPKGDHRVEFFYRPRSVVLGLWALLAGAALLALAGFKTHRV